jgi:transcriptional regulator with XRE-family HTH domain
MFEEMESCEVNSEPTFDWSCRSTVLIVEVDPPPFDLDKLSRWIDRACAESGLTRTALAREVGVAMSTIRRFRTARDAEADGVLALVGWLGVPPERFVTDSSVAGTLLPPAGDGLIRVDMGLVAGVSPQHRLKRTGARTSIQQLVIAAQASGRTVASLTRWSPF